MEGLAAFSDEIQRLSELLDEAHIDLEEQTVLAATTEQAYRKGKAEAWVSCPTNSDSSNVWTAARREAWVNAETAELRRRRDVAEGLKRASLESIRSLRGQISAVQTLLNGFQEEAKFARSRPDY